MNLTGKICKHCKNEFFFDRKKHEKPNIFRKRLFCSKKCSGGYRKGIPNFKIRRRKNITCLVCGKIREVISSSKIRHCSGKCAIKTTSSKENPLFEIIKSKRVQTRRFKNSYIAWNKGKKYPQVAGSKNGNWKGGHSPLRMNSQEYKNWKIAIFIRDGRKCTLCSSNIKIQAHHIKPWCDYPELRFDINNGITLCEKCHKIETYNFLAKRFKSKHPLVFD